MRWYARDGDAFIAGTIGLTLEEVGAYTLILDAIYSRNNHLPDDPDLICKLLRCDPRVWRRIRERLLTLGKLEIVEGNVTNRRASRGVGRALATADLMSKLGKRSAEKRKKNNSRTSAASLQPPSHRLLKKEESLLPSSVTTSEQIQPSQELLEIERKKRPTPGSLATAPFDSALARPAHAAAYDDPPIGLQ